MIKNGSRVKFHYTLKVDEQVVESSVDEEPGGLSRESATQRSGEFREPRQ